MQFSRRSLAEGEINHELLWLTISLGSLLCAAIWFALGLPWPTCVFHDLTGLPCLTCGATRCSIAFFHGHLFTAWAWNPFAFCALCAITLFDVYALIVLVADAPRLRIVFSTRRSRQVTRFVVIAGLALNWIYLLSHSRNFS
jgi:hypothetical protein